MKLNELSFPIFPIENFIDLYHDGKILYATTETEEHPLIVDNKNIQGKTLGQRRLRIKGKKFKLETPIHSLSALLKYKSKSRYYIDNFGFLFRYKKSKYVPLKYHKIKGYRPVDGEYIIELDGLHQEFGVPIKKGMTQFKYADVLYTDTGPILYEVVTGKKSDTRRMI